MAPKREAKPVWVMYNALTGGVVRVCFREPTRGELPKPGSPVVVLETTLTDWAIQKAHQLIVRSGRVVHAPSLGGI